MLRLTVSLVQEGHGGVFFLVAGLMRTRIMYRGRFLAQLYIYIYMCHGLNSHCFHIIGDKLINPIVGVYIPIIRIPSLKVGLFPSPI